MKDRTIKFLNVISFLVLTACLCITFIAVHVFVGSPHEWVMLGGGSLALCWLMTVAMAR